jgi:hypothetical protein
VTKETSVRAWLKTLSAGVAALAVLAVATKVVLPVRQEWRTKQEAARHLTTLRSWEGVRLRNGKVRATCADGAWSTTEANSRVVYKVKTNAEGEDTLRSFVCLLFHRGHEWQVYVMTRPGGRWSVKRDIVLVRP